MLVVPYHGYQVEIKWNLSFADQTFVIPCAQPQPEATSTLDEYLAIKRGAGVDRIVGKRGRSGPFVLKVRGRLKNLWARSYIADFDFDSGAAVLRCTARLPLWVKLLSRFYGVIFVLSAIFIPICAILDGGKALALAVIAPWVLTAIWAGLVGLGNSLAAGDTEYFKDTLTWLLGSSNAAVA